MAPEQVAEAKKHGVPVAFENDLGMRFVLIPAGTFLMGSPEAERQRVVPEGEAYFNVEPMTATNMDTSALGPEQGARNGADWRRAELARMQGERLHEVTLTKPFYVQITETLYSQYARMDPPRRRADGDYSGMVGEDPFPVDLISWEDAAGFAHALSVHDPAKESLAMPAADCVGRSVSLYERGSVV